jgi:hypothetical protein
MYQTGEELMMNDSEYQRTLRQLDANRMAWRYWQEGEAKAKAELIAYVQSNAAEFSEYTLATKLGVTRKTVRSWLGK